MAVCKNIDFTHLIHDERERTALEAPAHGLGVVVELVYARPTPSERCV